MSFSKSTFLLRSNIIFIKSVLLLLFSDALLADQGEWFQRNSWSAFASQTAIYSSDYNFLSQSDDNVSFDLWEAGLLVSTAVKDKLTFSAQLTGRKVSEASGSDLRVDYAFFSYPFYQTVEHTLGLRLGRIRSSYGLYNETRDIPHTRTGVVMPQSVYFDMTRNSFYSADGIEVFGYRDFDDKRLSAQIFYSKPVTDSDETGEGERFNPTNLEGDKSLLAKISFGSEYDGLRAAFTYYRPEYNVDVEFDVEFPAGTISIDDDDSTFYSESMLTSLEYNQFDWSITLEYLRHKFLQNIPSLGSIPGREPGISFYEEAFYVQGLYRFDEQWDAYLRYDSAKPRISLPAFIQRKWNDVNVGGSFRPSENWLFRAEIHYIEGVSRLFSRDNTFSNLQDQYWAAAMFQIAYKW